MVSMPRKANNAHVIGDLMCTTSQLLEASRVSELSLITHRHTAYSLTPSPWFKDYVSLLFLSFILCNANKLLWGGGPDCASRAHRRHLGSCMCTMPFKLNHLYMHPRKKGGIPNVNSGEKTKTKKETA